MPNRLKLIHVVENLDKGAVENWIVNIFIESKKIRPNWEWTFYCILGKEGRLDEKVRVAGGKIIYAPCTISEKSNFLKALRKTLKQGQYDIIHSHHDYLSGFYLIASQGIKFKKRILQIHNTDEALPVGNKFLRKILLSPLKLLAVHYSDLIVGISVHTLKQFIKTTSLSKKQSKVLYYGVDMSPFEMDVSADSFKDKLSLPATVKLLLFSGRMNELKNPVFVVDILAELLKTDKDYVAVFVGEGDLLKDVEQQAAHYNISSHVKLLGWRKDLPAIMKACDVFVFPRQEEPKEGLGLVVVEAQASGLPMLLSYGILEDAIEIPDLANFITLDNNPAEWAEKIITVKKNISSTEALEKMKNSKFALPIATQNLVNLYEC